MSITKTAEQVDLTRSDASRWVIPEEKTRLRDQVWFQRLVIWGGLAVVWEIAGIIAGPFFIPRFSQVFIEMIAIFFNGNMVILLNTLRQMFVGFVLAAVVGIPIGLLMGGFRRVNYVFGIFVNALFVTSLAALLPFIIILFGTQFTFRVAIVFLFSVFYIIINTAAGVRSVDADLLETATAFCTPRLRIFTRIILPAALPFVIAGLRLGLGHSIKGMIIAELWITVGTGRRLVDLGLARNLPEFFALATWIVIISAGLTQLLLRFQKWLTPWAVDIIGIGARRKK